MELNILIEGGGPDKQKIADQIANRFGTYSEVNLQQYPNDYDVAKRLRRIAVRPGAILFTPIETPEALAMCIKEMNEYRKSILKDTAAVYVCEPSVIVLSHGVPIVIEGRVDAEQVDELRDVVAAHGPVFDHPILTKAEPSIEFLGPGEPVYSIEFGPEERAALNKLLPFTNGNRGLTTYRDLDDFLKNCTLAEFELFEAWRISRGNAPTPKGKGEELYDKLKLEVQAAAKAGKSAAVRTELKKYIKGSAPRLCNLSARHFEAFNTFITALNEK